MTAPMNRMVYIVGKQKLQDDARDGHNAERIAEAVARTLKYIRRSTARRPN